MVFAMVSSSSDHPFIFLSLDSCEPSYFFNFLGSEGTETGFFVLCWFGGVWWCRWSGVVKTGKGKLFCRRV